MYKIKLYGVSVWLHTVYPYSLVTIRYMRCFNISKYTHTPYGALVHTHTVYRKIVHTHTPYVNISSEGKIEQECLHGARGDSATTRRRLLPKHIKGRRNGSGKN